ncbi:eCIS core domain-containing protein [Celerinatantimonas yamalensis]|uniref:DUF4157 domain-containing protein n=1 Tax=Celerinatantimonas yamalensis TaxID=559956 RepID=A0ABW9G8R8_9GAMM
MQRYTTQPEKTSQASATSITQCISRHKAFSDHRNQSQLLQRKTMIQRNQTGLPHSLKTGMEQLSGMNLDHVRVNYHSAKPAAVQAHAYAQGNHIHLASGQEKHLPHELGHVVQQMQGRVQPTTSVAGMAVNDNPALEHEADKLGAKAMQMKIDHDS